MSLLGLLVSYRKHQQKNAQLLHLPSSDLSTCQTLLLMYFEWGWKEGSFFFNVSYELKMRNISLLFTTERNTRKHSVMQKISDTRICPVCSQSFFLTVLPPGCKVSLTEKSLALSPWAESQIWCTHITDLPRGTQCSTDWEMSAVAKTSSFAHVIIKYS